MPSSDLDFLAFVLVHMSLLWFVHLSNVSKDFRGFGIDQKILGWGEFSLVSSSEKQAKKGQGLFSEVCLALAFSLLSLLSLLSVCVYIYTYIFSLSLSILSLSLYLSICLFICLCVFFHTSFFLSLCPCHWSGACIVNHGHTFWRTHVCDLNRHKFCCYRAAPMELLRMQCTITSDNKRSDFLFPLQPPHPPYPDKPPAHPTTNGLISVHFGSVWPSAPFGSVSGLFRVRFGSISGCWVGSGWGRGEGLL